MCGGGFKYGFLHGGAYKNELKPDDSDGTIIEVKKIYTQQLEKICGGECTYIWRDT